MSEDPHRRAERLMIESRIGQMPDSDLSWLDAHLEECERCGHLARATERAVQSLWSVPVRLPAALVAATQFRVQQRAQELRGRRRGPILAWLGVGLSLCWVVLSGPFLWRALHWAAVKTGVPSPIWQMAFGLWWFIPAIAVAAVLSAWQPGGFARHEVEEPMLRNQSM